MSVDNNIKILSKGAAPVPKPAIAAIIVLLASVVAMVFYMRSKPASSQETVPGQELIIGVDRATLYVPKDAATLAGVISISSLESNLYTVAGEEPEWYRSQVVDVEYLNSDGVPYLHVTFPKPVLICFMIEELWPDYLQRPDEYQVQYYAEEQSPPAWVALPMSANAERYQLCGETNHLSIFALALIPREEIPITGSSPVPTSTGSITPTPTGTLRRVSSPTRSSEGGLVAPPVSTQAALTATDVPPTDVPPTVAPTDIPTVAPTDPPTEPPPPTDPPTEPPPPTDPPPAPTDPPVLPTDPPVVP